MRTYDDACAAASGSLRSMPHPGRLQRSGRETASSRLVSSTLCSSRLARAGPPAARKNTYTITDPAEIVNPKSSIPVVVL